MTDHPDIPMSTTQRLTLMQAQLKLLAHDCESLAATITPPASRAPEKSHMLLAPSVREAVRLANLFIEAACVIEKRARAGRGGIVRVKELATAVQAMSEFLDALPAGQLDQEA